ncbi:Protein BOLA2 [Picochlorum sp. SENEW3]|nr:Protein BOLA2 [Picochlorum sp. SENEW3]
MTEPMQHVNAQMLQDRLREYLKSDQVEVLDISGGCGSSFEVYAVSDMFEGKRLLQRHKLVNEGIGQSLMAEIHALSIKKTKTVAEEGEWNTSIRKKESSAELDVAHALFASGKVVIPDFLPIFSPFGAISKLVLINEPGEFLDVEKDPLDEFSVHLFLHRPFDQSQMIEF